MSDQTKSLNMLVYVNIKESCRGRIKLHKLSWSRYRFSTFVSLVHKTLYLTGQGYSLLGNLARLSTSVSTRKSLVSGQLSTNPLIKVSIHRPLLNVSFRTHFNGEILRHFSTTLDNRAKLMLVIPTKLSLCTRSMKKVTEKVAKEVAKASSEESSNLVPKVAPISSPKFPLPPPHRKGARSPRTTFVPNFIFVDPRVIDDYYATNITHLHIINPLNKYYFLFTGELYTMQQLNELCLSYMYKSKNVVKYEVEKKNKRFYFVIQINSVDNIVQYFKDILARNFQFRSFEQQKNKIRVKLQNNNSFLQQATLRNRYPLINSFPLLTKYFKPTEVKLKTIEPQLTDFELYKKDFEFITNYFIKHKLKFNPFSEDLLPLRKFYIRIEHITLIKVFVKSLKKDLTKAKDKMNDILESHKRYKYRTYEDYDKIDEDHQQSRDHVI